MSETNDFIYRLKDLPPIKINQDELSKIPKHKRASHVITNYLKDGDVVTKSILVKYFTNAIFGIVEALNVSPVTKKYINTLRMGVSLFELNTIFKSIIRVTDTKRFTLSAEEIMIEIIKDNFLSPDEVLTGTTLNHQERIITDNIFDISESACEKYSIEILAREIEANEYIENLLMVAKYQNIVFLIHQNKCNGLISSNTTTMYVSANREKPDYVRNDELAELINNLKKLCVEMFCSKIDPKHNYVIIDKSGYNIHQKKNVNQKIYNIDYEDLHNSIVSSLKRGQKRGYAIVGDPGTGKSLMIHKLINDISDIPTFIVKNECLNETSDISNVFSMVTGFKAILIFDDFDGLDVQEKGYITNEFLYQMESTGDFNGIIIATVNDPSKVHYSLMNRPGRLDEVYLMKYPEDINEIHEIFMYKIEHTNGIDDIVFPKINSPEYSQFLAKCLENHFTHARVASCIDYSISHYNSLETPCLMKSIEKLIEFSTNAKMFSDNGELKDARQKYCEEPVRLSSKKVQTLKKKFDKIAPASIRHSFQTFGEDSQETCEEGSPVMAEAVNESWEHKSSSDAECEATEEHWLKQI